MDSKTEKLRIFEFKKWKEGQSAPCNVLRGSSVICGSIVYCSTTTSKAVFAYDSASCEWSTLPECPQQYFALAVVDGTLTAVGGFRGLRPTGALQSFVEDESVEGTANAKQWKEILPPMPTKRGRIAAFCSGKHLITVAGQLAVVGGRLGPGVTVRNSSPGGTGSEDGDQSDEGGYVRTVEMLDTECNQWYSLASLPQATSDLSISLCGGNLYLLGGWSSKDRTKAVFTSHLQTLLRTATDPSTSSAPRHSPSSVWQRIADVPAYACATVVLYNTVLVAVGGFGDDEAPTDEVYSYEPVDDSWHVVGHLSTARYQAVAATLPGNNVFVAGGYNAKYKSTGLVEIGSV